MKTSESMLKRGDLHWANLLLCSCGSGVGEQRWTPAQIRSPWGIGRRATGAGLEPGLLSGSGVSCNGSQSLPDSKEHFWPLVFTSTAFPFKFLEWTCRVYRSLLRSLHSFKDFLPLLEFNVPYHCWHTFMFPRTFLTLKYIHELLRDNAITAWNHKTCLLYISVYHINFCKVNTLQTVTVGYQI